MTVTDATVWEHYFYWAGNVLIVLGVFFAFTGALGVVRMPDFFSRLHPAGVIDSLGVPLVMFGLILHAGPTLVSGKLLLLMLFILLTSPTACHALAKSAFLSGIPEDELAALKKAKEGEIVPHRSADDKHPMVAKGADE